MPQEDILDEKQSKRGGGPKTPAGKEKASRNSTKHGMRSKQVLILADETAEGYEKTRAGWLAEYEPEGYQQVRLVEQLILNDWLLQRANRRVLQTEEALVGGEDNWHPADWESEQEHKLELMQRYKTTAERAFYRSLSAVEHLRKDILRDNARSRKLERENDAHVTRIAELEKENRELKPAIDTTSKTVRPAAAKLETPLTKGQMTFQGQKWTPRQDFLREIGGMGIQRMTVDSWLELIEEEKKSGTKAWPCNLLECRSKFAR